MYFYARCPNPIYFDAPSMIIYLVAIETLICHSEIKFNRVYFLWFGTKYVTRFSKDRIELMVA